MCFNRYEAAFMLSGFFGVHGILHLLKGLGGVITDFPTIGLTVSPNAHLVLFVVSAAIATLLYKYSRPHITTTTKAMTKVKGKGKAKRKRR